MTEEELIIQENEASSEGALAPSHTRSKFAVKVYIILADWFSWKSLMKEKYYFSRSELAESLGYSKDNSEFRTTIDHVLESLNREGIIQYIPVNVKRITDTGREIVVPLFSTILFPYVQRNSFHIVI